MKRKLTKCTSIALVIAMAISTLAGCGGTASTQAPDAGSEKPSTETASPEASDADAAKGADAAAEAEGAFHDTAELVIDYAKAVDPKGADVVDGSFQSTPELKGALADQMIGTQNQFEGMNIGFSQHRIAGSEWYEQLVDFAQAEADYLGVNLTIYDANDDMNQQIADVETLINLGMESIIVNPYNSTNVGLDSIIAADIPLTVVNQAVDFSGPFTFVSADVQDSGYKTGFELARYYDEKNGWKDEVKAFVLSSAPQEKESDLRRWGQIMGWTDYMLDKYGKNNLNIVAYQYYQWLPEPAMNATLDVLQANPDIDVIFAACDGGAQGVEAALEQIDRLGDILVCTIDGRKSVLQWIKDGDKGMVCDAYNDPRQMGKWAVYMAALQASGVSTPSTFYVMNDLVTTENVDNYLDPNSTY
ncbi:substrate-binding domain-containing protein [Diplocloster hominis]|uniref:substrate-binding domain-containing protein n=1 Tax=Diplocloster hominis TaxID=3079010 RepID=UPI0031BA9E58